MLISNNNYNLLLYNNILIVRYKINFTILKCGIAAIERGIGLKWNR